MRSKILILSLSLFILVSTASAQSNSTATDKQILQQIDGASWISDVDWNPENSSDQIQVTIESEVPKLIWAQEIPDYTGQSGSFDPMEDYQLTTGTNEIFIPVNGRSTLGVAVTTSNNGAYYKRPDGGELPQAKGFQVLFFVGMGILLYESFTKIRVKI